MTDSQFTQYYNENYTALLSFAKRFTKNENDAEDLVQETVVKAYKGKHTFIPNSNFKSWAFTILRNTYITRFNKRKRRKLASLPVEDLVFAADKNCLATNDAISTLRVEMINDSIENLSYKTRLPFMMHVEGYQYDEIAETLNIPVGTVKSRINFARNKLKNLTVLQELQRA